MTGQEPPPSRAENLPLVALGRRVADEIGTLASLSCEVQSALSLCHFAAHTDPEAIRGLQAIDRITQTLEDLSRIMRAITNELPTDLALPGEIVSSHVRLQQLARSLDPGLATGHRCRTPADPSATRTDAGEIDWL